MDGRKGSVVTRMIRIAQISHADGRGGAAIAAYRLHKTIARHGVESRMLVLRSYTEDPSVTAIGNGFAAKAVKLATTGIEKAALSLWPGPRSTVWSPGLLGQPGVHRHPIVTSADVLSLYWVAGGFLSVRGIGRLLGLNKPIVWRLSDLWPFTGGCHYPGDCRGYQGSCGKCPQLGSRFSWDLSRAGLHARCRTWDTSRLTIVAPSRWIAACARSSPIIGDCRIDVVPTGVDIEEYRVIPKAEARRRLGLPADRHLILFGAMSSTSDPRKGFPYFKDAVKCLRRDYAPEHLDLVVFGSNGTPAHDLPFRCHLRGQLWDDSSKALHYAACDVFVAPSTEENLPNTVLESMACGTPTVAFAVGGLPEVIDHQESGYLARPLDAEDLAEGVRVILGDPHRYDAICRAARRKIATEHDNEIAAARYVSLYRELIAGRAENQGSKS